MQPCDTSVTASPNISLISAMAALLHTVTQVISATLMLALIVSLATFIQPCVVDVTNSPNIYRIFAMAALLQAINCRFTAVTIVTARVF